VAPCHPLLDLSRCRPRYCGTAHCELPLQPLATESPAFLSLEMDRHCRLHDAIDTTVVRAHVDHGRGKHRSSLRCLVLHERRYRICVFLHCDCRIVFQLSVSDICKEITSRQIGTRSNRSGAQPAMNGAASGKRRRSDSHTAFQPCPRCILRLPLHGTIESRISRSGLSSGAAAASGEPERAFR
jgi:hypothetical protein